MKFLWARLQLLYNTSRGRAARPASMGFNAFKTTVQSVLMGLVFLALGSFVAWHIETWLMQFMGIHWRFNIRHAQFWGALLFVLGWILAWTSAYFMVTRGDGTPLPLDCPNRLVLAGPYLWVRNPMAMGSLTQGASIALWLGSPLIAFYVLCGALIWNYLARPWEERDLTLRFGTEFQDYQRNVRCWIPRLTAYRQPI